MAPITTAQLQSLRWKYNAAYTAYRSCVEALSNAVVERRTPSPELLEQEAKALRELNEARERYRDALLQMALGADALVSLPPSSISQKEEGPLEGGPVSSPTL